MKSLQIGDEVRIRLDGHCPLHRQEWVACGFCPKRHRCSMIADTRVGFIDDIEPGWRSSCPLLSSAGEHAYKVMLYAKVQMKRRRSLFAGGMFAACELERVG